MLTRNHVVTRKNTRSDETQHMSTYKLIGFCDRSGNRSFKLLLDRPTPKRQWYWDEKRKAGGRRNRSGRA